MVRQIAQKYDNVQKGRKRSGGPLYCVDRSGAKKGDIMSGALIETNARIILNQGISQGIQQGISQGEDKSRRETAIRMLEAGKLTVDEIAKYSGLSIEEVEQLAEKKEE